jgi:hypothetical protein
MMYRAAVYLPTVVPDVAHTRGMEIYSVDEVTSTDPITSSR